MAKASEKPQKTTWAAGDELLGFDSENGDAVVNFTQAAMADLLADLGGGGGGTDDQTAAEVPFTPTGTIAATNVQTAVAEVATEAAAGLTAHTGDATDAHDASAISLVDAGAYFTGTDVETALQELGAGGGGDVSAHLADATDAHDASAISVLDTAANFAGTNVETVLAEIQANIDAFPDLAADDPSELDISTAGGVTTLTIEPTIARRMVIENITASMTPALTDRDKLKYAVSNAPVITLPQDSVVAFPISTQIHFMFGAFATAMTFAAGAGATVNKDADLTLAAKKDVPVTALKVAVDTWTIFGGLVPA